MYILAVNGSPNDDGNCAFLLNEILSKIEGAETEVVSVNKAVNSAKWPFCVVCSNPCNKNCYKGTELEELYDKVEKADFVIFASPVYFGGMSGQLKTFFDKTRAIRGEKRWLGKPMAAISVGATKYGGQERTIDHIHSCALVLGMQVLGNGSELGMGHFGVSAQRPSCEDEYAKKQCESLANAIMNYLKKITEK